MILLLLTFGAFVLLWASGSFGLWISGPLLLFASFHVLNIQRFLHLPSPGLCLPVIGHLYKLLTREGMKDPVNTFWNIYKDYSKAGILWFRAFNIDSVFIGDYDIVKKVFTDPDVEECMFSNYENFGFCYPSIPGVILNDGNSWLSHKRLTLKTIKDFKTSNMNDIIEEEVRQFMTKLKEADDKSHDFETKFSFPIMNSLWKITSSEGFDYEDPKYVSIVAGLNSLLQDVNCSKNLVYLAYPWMVKIPFLRPFINKDDGVNGCQELFKMIRNTVKNHEDTLDPNEPRDIIDLFLMEILKTTDVSSNFYGFKAREHLVSTLFDLFVTGSETSTTLIWCVLYMVRYPEVMEEVQKELDMVVGRNRMPQVEDRDSLPYTQAVLMEIQRYSCILPLGVPYMSRKEVKIGSMRVPPHTTIYCLHTQVLKDDTYWEDPCVFRPSRFLKESGEINITTRGGRLDTILGRRQQLGENISKSQLFLYFSSLLHQFSLQPEISVMPPPDDYTPGFTISPKSFSVKLKQRL